MKKILFSLIAGFLILWSSPSKAQRIEQDTLFGSPRLIACTNYDLHLKQKQDREFNKFLLYAGVGVGILLLNEATRHGPYNEGFIPDQAIRLYGSTFVTVVGACVVVGLYKWHVHVQNEVGL